MRHGPLLAICPALLLLAACVTLLLAGCASDQTKPAASVQAGSQEPFVTKSAVFFPDSVGDFELYQKYAYPDAPDGVQLTYSSKTLPTAKLDIFVFVLGRGPVAEALKQGDNRMRGEIQAVTKAGVYQDLQFTDDTDFHATTTSGKDLPGRRLRMSFGEHGHKMVSAGYMFYKQLYLVEVRITAPAEAGDALTQAGDDAARRIVPLVHMLNQGGCGTVVVHWDPNSGSNALLAALQQAADQEDDGCVADPKPDQLQPKDGEDMLSITYKPEDWQ